jgi:predicted lipoprotein with Yx(FWY)xxD motif
MLAALVAAGAAALTACSTAGTAAPNFTGSNHQPAVLAANVTTVSGTALGNNVPDNSGDFANGPRTNPVAEAWTQVSVSAAGNLNPVLVNGIGHTLYRFDKDTAHPSKSNCNGPCQDQWPPLLVKPGATIFVDGVSQSEIGTVKRDDGTIQVTVGGWPAYLFAKDTEAGQTNGEGVGGTWYGLTPTGGKAEAPTQTGSQGVGYVTGTAAAHNAPPNTGDFFNGPNDSPQGRKWVQLNVSSVNGLNPVVTNGTGFVLYRFDNDTAHPSKSNCYGACAVKWPPVTVVPGSHIFVNGVPTSEVGLVKRDDGTMQVTIGGWPIYRFSGDTAPGQTNGEGVGGTWFGVQPDGGKALPPAGSSTGNNSAGGAAPTTTSAPPTSSTSTVTLGNGSVTLFDSVNPADDTSQGIAGPGCQNVARPNAANRLELTGGPVKIWTGPNCTGTSHVVTASIPDLNTIGFGNKIESIRFGN